MVNASASRSARVSTAVLVLSSALLASCLGQTKACPCMDPNAAAAATGKPAELAGCSGKAAPAQDGLVDDFEDDNGQIVLLDGRDGYWWKNADKEGAKFTEPAADAPLKFADEGAAGSAKSLHFAGSTVKGSDQAYGVEVGTNLVSQQGSLYDGSKYVGVSFMAKVGPKSVKKVRFNMGDVNTHPDLGACKSCWNHFSKDIELSTEWKEYQVSFKDMVQRPGWGEPRPKSISSKELYTLTFAFEGSGGEFELFVDDIQFLECKP